MTGTIFHWHLRLAWVAALAACLWGLSGILHPVLVWTMPQPAERRPPPAVLDLAGVPPPATALSAAGLEPVAELRASGALGRPHYAVRLEDSAVRRWFDAATGAELADGDRLRAEALARHFSGERDAPVRLVEPVAAFDDDYPAVNRLLPVWRVAFDRPDGLTAYVDTGGDRLATLTDDRKRVLQALFRTVHTMSFLRGWSEAGRTLVVALLVGSVLAMAVLGVGLLVLLRRRKRLSGARGWHRGLAYAAALPALAFTVSGLWQVLHGLSAEDAPARPRPLALDIAALTVDPAALGPDLPPGHAVTGLTVVRGAAERPLLRLELAPPRGDAAAGHGPHGAHGAHGAHAHPGGPAPATAEAFFRGMALSGPAIYVDAATGAPATDDAALARHLALAATGLPETAILSADPVTRFTDEYGFLHKRLPVWRIAVDAPGNPRIFVDTRDAVVAATVTDADLLAATVFDWLHKGKWAEPLGRVPRDVVLILLVLAILAATGVGVVLRLRRAATARRVATPRPETAA